MNLYKLTNIIVDIARGEPNVNTSYAGDIYEINEHPDIKYSVVCITQGTHRCDDAYRYYNYTIFYVDRQVSDESNKLDVQSIGIEVLDDILSKLEDNFQVIIGDHQYQTFTESFADLCAGVYITVTLQVPLTCNFDTPVVINPTMGTATFRANGDYYPQNYGWYGFDRVVVDVVAEECEETIRELQAQVSKLQDDIADMPDLNVTANGTYAHPEDKVGFKSVTVNVPETQYVTSSITITENGSYTVPTGVDGYSSVTVNVSTADCTGVISEKNAKIEYLEALVAELKSQLEDCQGEPIPDPPTPPSTGYTAHGDLTFYLIDGSYVSQDYPTGVIDTLPRYIGGKDINKIRGEAVAIVIGDNVTELGKSVLNGFLYVTTIQLGSHLTTIGDNVFSNCKPTTLTIPSTVTSIGSSFPQVSVTDIYSYPTTAPQITSGTFIDAKTGGKLHVPANATGYESWLTDNLFLKHLNWTLIYDI